MVDKLKTSEKKTEKLFAIIVAGGNGSRMKSDVPKQFMLLNNKPLLMHTIERFATFDPKLKIVVVLPHEHLSTWNELCKTYQFKIKHQVVPGGKNRFESVVRGLRKVDDIGIVFIHDGVRPLVSQGTIQRCLNMTLQKGNAVPVIPVVESMRMINGINNYMVDRSKFVNIQTPQVFKSEEIKSAYTMAGNHLFTDDSSVLELLGKKINLVEGNRENIKITHPIDLKIAEILLQE